jgi:hypothetical protein
LGNKKTEIFEAMTYLSKYTPAETILILDNSGADIKELLKTTFIHLLLKEVLEITTITRESSSSRRTIRTYKYIIKGKNFNTYKPLEHELVFLSPYQKSSSIKILTQHLIRMGFQNAISESKYITVISQSNSIKRYFTKNIIQMIFGGFTTNQEGINLKEKIKIEIALVENDLKEFIETDKDKAMQILNVIGGNVFLLKNIEVSHLKQIDSEVLMELNRQEKNYSSGSGCYGCSTWDSGCTGCGNSGCSSSGCSGCGGCGGGCS